MTSIDPTPSDERAVSPVIGVIMMVAVTVILAATLGTVVLDFGGQAVATAPTASLSVEADLPAENLTIDHRGGDPLQASGTRLLVEKVNATTTEVAQYEPVAGAGTLTVGREARVSMGTGVDGVDWPVGGTLEFTNGEDEFTGLVTGDRVTITVVDTASQRVIYETTVTV